MAKTVPLKWLPMAIRFYYALPDHVPWDDAAFGALPARTQRVLTGRLALDGGGRVTQRALAEALGVSVARVAQIERDAVYDLLAPLLGGGAIRWDANGYALRSPYDAGGGTPHPWWLVP